MNEQRSSGAIRSRRLPMRTASGYTLVEVLLATVLISIILAGLSGVTFSALEIREEGLARSLVAQEAQFAMRRMVEAASRAPSLLIPLAEDTNTGNIESIFNPGVLVVQMDPTLDRDRDGFADADNDKDGRVDEDWPADSNFDGAVGILQLDDDNSGITDVSFAGTGDDDETGFFGGSGEDPIDGIDNDGDGTVDEDPPADMNGDGAPGIALVDDDGDGQIDEGSADDDDEDGVSDEDWIDSIAYFLSGTNLIERYPNPSPSSGTDYTERTVAENVQTFRVERLPRGTRRFDLVEITLTLGTPPIVTTVETKIRIGAGAR